MALKLFGTSNRASRELYLLQSDTIIDKFANRTGMKNDVDRIALVAGGVRLGGATTFILNLGGELVRRKIPVLVVSLEHENPYATDFEVGGIPLHIEDERTTIFEDRVERALKVLRDFRATAVIACLGPSSFEILRYLPDGVTRLGMIQSDFPENYPPFAPYVRFMDGIAAVSREIERNLGAHPVLSAVPAHYLPYGVSIPSKTQRRLWTREEPLKILYLGRLCRPQKRVHIFPQILSQLETAKVSFQWTIAGDGPERSWLENEMRPLRAESVRFTGAISYVDVPRLLDSHDVFLLPSEAEGLPISLLEAMAHGLVPVVSNLPSGVSEVVDAASGILVSPDNIAGYAAGILWLCQNPWRLSEMAAKGQHRVRADYSLAAMADRWLTLLRQLNKNARVEWPQIFDVRGPLNQDSFWFRQPMRSLRRGARWVEGTHLTIRGRR